MIQKAMSLRYEPASEPLVEENGFEFSFGVGFRYQRLNQILLNEIWLRGAG